MIICIVRMAFILVWGNHVVIGVTVVVRAYSFRCRISFYCLSLVLAV